MYILHTNLQRHFHLPQLPQILQINNKSGITTLSPPPPTCLSLPTPTLILTMSPTLLPLPLTTTQPTTTLAMTPTTLPTLPTPITTLGIRIGISLHMYPTSIFLFSLFLTLHLIIASRFTTHQRELSNSRINSSHHPFSQTLFALHHSSPRRLYSPYHSNSHRSTTDLPLHHFSLFTFRAPLVAIHYLRCCFSQASLSFQSLTLP